MSKRIGCLTSSGLISALLTLLGMMILVITQGFSLFSPGPLRNQPGETLNGTNSHAEIGGECSRCHTAPWSNSSMESKCIECHLEIADQLIILGSLHGSIFINNLEISCRTCHPEHEGISKPATILKKFNFPHDNFGFSLNKHKLNWENNGIACQNCHGLNFTSFEKISCISCHQDRDPLFMVSHVDDFGADCQGCHDGLETYGKLFDHNDYLFKLTGRHAQAACKDCHIEPQTKLDLINTPQDCYTCHSAKDNHAGRLGIACGDCHSAEGWKPAKFDHDLAQFKLRGKHIGVECGSCHLDDLFFGTPQDCVSCHIENDVHQEALGNNCESCHTVDGWIPTTFDHNQSAYPLTGSHITVSCEKCHFDKEFINTPTDCYSCHVNDDKHRGLYGTVCSICHNSDGWFPSTFNHALSRFPLTGAHIPLACTRCHSNYNFQAASPVCSSCHAEPAFHAGSFGIDCSSCHTTSNWLATYTGPHPSFGEHGGINHEGASCRDCHTVNLRTATCTKCHESNNPGD